MKHTIEIEGFPEGWIVTKAEVCTSVKDLYDSASVGVVLTVEKIYATALPWRCAGKTEKSTREKKWNRY